MSTARVSTTQQKEPCIYPQALSNEPDRAEGLLNHQLQRILLNASPTPAQRVDRLITCRDLIKQYPHLLDPKVQDQNTNIQRHQLFQIGVDADDLPLVCASGVRLYEQGQSSPAQSLKLASALWRSGDTFSGLEICRQRLLSNPNDDAPLSVMDDMLDWRASDWPFPAWPADWASDDVMKLEPLGPQHVDDFFLQYQDPMIAERCCLPVFKSKDEWHQWLQHHRYLGDELIFGIWHHHWGFIGSVSMVMADDIGFFYYWIGADFQGNGFGPHAVSLLLKLAEDAWGLRLCFAKCFTDNLPSQKGLEKLGFKKLDIPIRTKKEQEEWHFIRASAGYTHSIKKSDELAFLFTRMGSSSQVLEIVTC